MTGEKKFYGWYLIAAFWLIYFINIGFVFYGSNVVNTAMVQALGMSRKSLGAGFALFHMLQSGLSAPLVALMLNRKGVRYTLTFGCVLIIAGALLMATVVETSLAFFAVFGILIGLGVGFGGILSVQTGVTIWFERKRALAMSIALSAAGVGGFVAAPTLSKLIVASGESWRNGWFFVAGLCTLSMILALLFVKNRPSDLGQNPDGSSEAPDTVKGRVKKGGTSFRTNREWTTKEALKTRSLWLIFIGIVGFLVPYLFCVAHGVIHFIDKGFSPTVAAMSLGMITLFSIIGRFTGGLLGDYIEPRFIWCGSLIFIFVGVVSCMVAENVIYIYLYSIFVGIGFGSAFILMPTIIGNYFGTAAFASIMGVISPIFTAFSSGSPLVAGLIHDSTGSYRIAFIGSLVFCLIGFISILMAKKDEQ